VGQNPIIRIKKNYSCSPIVSPLGMYEHAGTRHFDRGRAFPRLHLDSNAWRFLIAAMWSIGGREISPRDLNKAVRQRGLRSACSPPFAPTNGPRNAPIARHEEFIGDPDNRKRRISTPSPKPGTRAKHRAPSSGAGYSRLTNSSIVADLNQKKVSRVSLSMSTSFDKI